MASNSNRDENLSFGVILKCFRCCLNNKLNWQICNAQVIEWHLLYLILDGTPLTSRFTSNNNSNSNSSNGGSLSFGGSEIFHQHNHFFNTRNNASQQHTNERRNRNSNNNSYRDRHKQPKHVQNLFQHKIQSVQQPSNSENATIQRMNDGSTC